MIKHALQTTAKIHEQFSFEVISYQLLDLCICVSSEMSHFVCVRDSPTLLLVDARADMLFLYLIRRIQQRFAPFAESYCNLVILETSLRINPKKDILILELDFCIRLYGHHLHALKVSIRLCITFTWPLVCVTPKDMHLSLCAV